MPGLPIGNYYASLGNNYAYFYAAQCVNENPVVPVKFQPIKDAPVKTGVAAGWNRLCTKPGTNYFVLLYLACGDDMNA